MRTTFLPNRLASVVHWKSKLFQAFGLYAPEDLARTVESPWRFDRTRREVSEETRFSGDDAH